ncbi:Oidioi.mRNA.OKI2018_I69.chr2.g5053.t1.cds [Oikopleura dioica]|uniref:Oidioi.mRNA.OKI2018_I69.chr2.g5053.t1.cds n=1 Tax=Oikopleura dioica TaxID=34765 RepID=A0ABN7SZQ0_OIKDI|nr:Oidioi.mRNA.OKI2018_I69.chr2.g5053.t1.cds [Oikopleura dioica]
MSALANINNWDPLHDDNLIMFANEHYYKKPSGMGRLEKPKYHLTQKMKEFYELYKNMNELPDSPHKDH